MASRKVSESQGFLLLYVFLSVCKGKHLSCNSLILLWNSVNALWVMLQCKISDQSKYEIIEINLFLFARE